MSTSTSISASGPTADGGTVTISGSVGAFYSPPPAPPRMLIGTDAVSGDLGRYSRRFDGAKWPGLSALPAECTAHPSISAVPTAAATTAFVTANPTRAGFRTYQHEVNTGKKDSPAAFMANSAKLDALFAAIPGGDAWAPVEIYGLYAQVHAKQKGLPDWTAYHSDQTGAKIIGWDCYRDPSTDPDGYPAPDVFFAPVLEAAAHPGIDGFMVCELGSPQLASDTTGYGLADWYAACLDYLAGAGAIACAVWNNIGTNNPTQLILSGTPVALWAVRDRIRAQ